MESAKELIDALAKATGSRPRLVSHTKVVARRPTRHVAFNAAVRAPAAYARGSEQILEPGLRSGVVEMTGPDTERERDGDVLVNDPMRVTDGIESSHDPIRTSARTRTPSRSSATRGSRGPAT